MITSQHDFSGAKLALFIGDELLVYLRDDIPNLKYAGMWDLPGGGREGAESPEECVLRELKEEFNLDLPETSLCYKSHQLNAAGNRIYFFVANGSKSLSDDIVFGDEGQFYKLANVSYFLNHENAIPHLKRQLSLYLDSTTA
jgi:8-oxo-dGTP diphosphatase